MTNLENPSQNGVAKTKSCPVCNAENDANSINCKTCTWYFPLAETPHYATELNRAKQQFKMLNAFNQLMQNSQQQQEMIQNINARMDGVEQTTNQLKQHKSNSPSFKHKYDYPALPPVAGPVDFDTEEKRMAWWKELETQWQAAFNVVSLQKAKDYQPNDEEINFVLTSPVLRFVGPRGIYPNMDFELTNLSGIEHIKDMFMLTFTQQAITNLEGIEHLENLKHLFVTGCFLKNLKEVYYLPQLEHLYANANQLEDIQSVENLTNLATFYCNDNELHSFEGITQYHAANLKDFYCLPNEKVPLAEEKRIETYGIKCKKGL